MCASSARVGAGLEETKAEQAPPSRKGADPGGEGCVDGDGGVGLPADTCSAPRSAPPGDHSSPSLRSPTQAPAGEGTHHGICSALTGCTCLSPLRNKTLMAASPGGC